MLHSRYEKILKSGKKIDWYGEQVPKDLITDAVKKMAEQIESQIDKLEGVDSKGKNDYINTLWVNIKNLPYTLNGDFYLKKKKEIEEKSRSSKKK